MHAIIIAACRHFHVFEKEFKKQFIIETWNPAVPDI
jgi:hypothetical protein